MLICLHVFLGEIAFKIFGPFFLHVVFLLLSFKCCLCVFLILDLYQINIFPQSVACPHACDIFFDRTEVLTLMTSSLSIGTPLQYSCLEYPMDRGAWWAAVHGVVKSRTRLSDFTFTFPFHALEKEMVTHSSILAWRIPGTGEPGGLPSVGSHRVGHDWSDLAAAVHYEVDFIRVTAWYDRVYQLTIHRVEDVHLGS